MKVTFGKVPQEQENQDESFVAEDRAGNTAEFYYVLDVKQEKDGSGMFTIRDTCNRYMPFDFEQLDELYEVINTLKTYRDDTIKFENYWKNVWGFDQ